MGRFEEAIEQFEIMFNGLSFDPTDTKAAGTGASDKADGTGSDPEALSFLGYAYGVAGERNKALDVLSKLMGLRKIRYVQPQHLATVYIGLGEDDSAFECLEVFRVSVRDSVAKSLRPRISLTNPSGRIFANT